MLLAELSPSIIVKQLSEPHWRITVVKAQREVIGKEPLLEMKPWQDQTSPIQHFPNSHSHFWKDPDGTCQTMLKLSLLYGVKMRVVVSLRELALLLMMNSAQEEDKDVQSIIWELDRAHLMTFWPPDVDIGKSFQIRIAEHILLWLIRSLSTREATLVVDLDAGWRLFQRQLDIKLYLAPAISHNVSTMVRQSQLQ